MKFNLDELIFNRTFKETMDHLNIQGSELAEKTGRSRNNISRIRGGKDCPTIKDFAGILIQAESICPGFFEEFCRRLISKSRKTTQSPKEFVSGLDSSEFGALMIAAGVRMCEKGELSEELAEKLVS